MERTRTGRPPLRHVAMAGMVGLLVVVASSCGSDPELEAGGSDATEQDATGSTGSPGTPPPPSAPGTGTAGGPTSIVDTGCNLAPATTAPGELSGGHIVCPDAGADQFPIPPETSVPSADEDGGVVTGTIVDEGTGAALPSVVGLDELGLAVASGADGRFGLAVATGTYHLNAIVNRDVTYVCSTPTVTIGAGRAETVAITCHH